MKTLFRSFAGAALLALLVFPLSCKKPVVSVVSSSPPTPLRAALNTIELRYENGESAEKVTRYVMLPSKANGFAINWISSKPEIITIPDGSAEEVILLDRINPKETNEQVVLTATITAADGTQEKREFPLTVYGKSQEAVDNALQKLSALPQFIVAGTGSISLPDFSDGITPKWTASPEGIINTKDGTVTNPSKTAKVTLSLTLTKNGAAAQKSVPITVYPAGTGLTLTQEIAHLTIPETMPHKSFSLPANFAGGTLTWKSDSPAVTISSGHSACVTPDLVPLKVQLTATLTKDGETADKTFTVTVPPLTSVVSYSFDSSNYSIKVILYSFTGSELTADGCRLIDSSPAGGTLIKEYTRRYTTRIDTEKKTLLLTKTHEWMHDSLIPIDEFARALQQEYTNVKPALSEWCAKMAELSRAPEVSWQTFCETLNILNTKTALHRKLLFNNEPFMPQEEEEVFNRFIRWSSGENGTSLSFDEFKKLSLSEQTAAIKRGIEAVRRQLLEPFAAQLQNTSWEDMITKGRQIWETDIETLLPQYIDNERVIDDIRSWQSEFDFTCLSKLIKKADTKIIETMKKPALYRYEMESAPGEYRLQLKRVYMPNLRWYEQIPVHIALTDHPPYRRGYTYSSDTHTIYCGYDIANPKRFGIECKESNGFSSYYAECSEDGSTFTAEKDNSSSQSITGTIHDNRDGTLILTISGQEPDTLKFDMTGF